MMIIDPLTHFLNGSLGTAGFWQNSVQQVGSEERG